MPSRRAGPPLGHCERSTLARDLHGLALSTDSGEAAAAFDRATLAYLKYRTDAGRHVAVALQADSDFVLAHMLRGYFNMLAYNQANSKPRRRRWPTRASGLAARRRARPHTSRH